MLNNLCILFLHFSTLDPSAGLLMWKINQSRELSFLIKCYDEYGKKWLPCNFTRMMYMWPTWENAHTRTHVHTHSKVMETRAVESPLPALTPSVCVTVSTAALSSSCTNTAAVVAALWTPLLPASNLSPAETSQYIRR